MIIELAHQVEDEYQAKDPTQKVFEKGHRNRYNNYWFLAESDLMILFT